MSKTYGTKRKTGGKTNAKTNAKTNENTGKKTTSSKKPFQFTTTKGKTGEPNIQPTRTHSSSSPQTHNETIASQDTSSQDTSSQETPHLGGRRNCRKLKKLKKLKN
jgi:hypothetical protein